MTSTRQTTPSEPAAPTDRRASFGATHGPTPPSGARSSQNAAPGPAREDAGAKPSNAAWVLLLPLLCCGGPLVIAAAASAGALGWGALGSGTGTIAAGLLIVRRQAVRSCGAAPGRARQHSRSAPIPDRELRR